MLSKKYQLAVAYRIYPRVSRDPAIFPSDKYKLARVCLKSFKESLGSLKVKIWAILDNCPREYEDLFKEFFDNDDLEILNLNCVGAIETFKWQMKILLEQKVSDVIYLAEDDYYYFPNQFEKMVKFLKENGDIDFVTPYDRLSDYLNNPNQKYKIKLYANKHWRSTKMAFSTFLTTKETLNKTKEIFNLKEFKGYVKDLPSDAIFWECLTKSQVFKLFRIIRLILKNRGFYYLYGIAWRYGWKQILFGKKWDIWVPVPTIATHMQYNHLSPSIDWNSVFNDAIKKLND